jgi:hypothetical protein
MGHVSITWFVQAPKEQKSKEAKALAAANSSKGKKKVLILWFIRAVVFGARLGAALLTAVSHAEVVQGQDEGQGKQHGVVRSGMFLCGGRGCDAVQPDRVVASMHLFGRRMHCTEPSHHD